MQYDARWLSITQTRPDNIDPTRPYMHSLMTMLAIDPLMDIDRIDWNQ